MGFLRRRGRTTGYILGARHRALLCTDTSRIRNTKVRGCLTKPLYSAGQSLCPQRDMLRIVHTSESNGHESRTQRPFVQTNDRAPKGSFSSTNWPHHGICSTAVYVNIPLPRPLQVAQSTLSPESPNSSYSSLYQLNILCNSFLDDAFIWMSSQVRSAT
jgi:hypothetical protein